MVPKNPIGSMANGEMLQVVIFSILLGLMLSLIDKEKSAFVIKLLDALTDALIKLVDMTPTDEGDINKIFTEVSLDKDETNKILEIIKKHI